MRLCRNREYVTNRMMGNLKANHIDLNKRWYAMRDLKRSNALLPAYKQLSEMGIQVFTPMVSRLFVRNGKRIRREVPFIQDLLFVNDFRQNLDPIVAKIPTLQYRFKKGGKFCEPIVVRDEDMSKFISAVQSSDNPKFYSFDEISALKCGSNIRMIGGVLDGCEGKLKSVRGSKTKSLIIVLPSLLAVSVEINDEFIELL